jgi:hypothetical protein
MGGNVFKQGQTRRYESGEYFELVEKIKPRLESLSNRFEVIPAYKGKESFGDMDILIIPSKEWNKSLLDLTFNSGGDVIHNGGVWSLVFEQIQVDLITTSHQEFNSALDYFGYNDYGNLRGKIIHKFGLKYGHDGLSLPVRSADNTIGTIILSQDPVEINEMFGFKLAEFETLEEMFESVIDSYFFNPTVFAWEQMNATSRIRDKKRTTYHGFLEYINGNDYPFQYEFEPEKYYYLPWIFENFPLKKPEYDALWARKKLLESAAEKFNGNLVRAWTGIDGVELGNLMRNLRPIMNAERVLDLSETELRNIVHEMYINLKESK